jgi:hypothetical protein
MELPLTKFKIISGAAFIFKNQEEIAKAMTEGGLDFVIAFEFKEIGKSSAIFYKASSKFKFLDALFDKIIMQT